MEGNILMTGQFDTYGKHCIVDFWGCDSQTIDNLSFMEALCVLAANAAGATVVDILYKKFDPQGLTILLLLEESHLSIHTYPEHGFVAFDCYTCSYLTQPGEAVGIFESILKPKQTIKKFIERGTLPN